MYRNLTLWIAVLAMIPGMTVMTGCTSPVPDKGRSSEKVEALLKKMTLEEKIGQLTLFSSDWEVTGPSLNPGYTDLVKQGKVGAILNAYTVDFIRELQRMAVEETRLGIPLIFGYDVIHGHRTIFPIPLGQACSWDLATIERSERIAAKEATAEGLNWTYTPMVDIARDPRWGRVSEGAGEDTWLGCRIAEARVKGFQGDDLSDPTTMMTCVKHFAAYGAAQAGRDYHTVDLSDVTLHESYLPPYHAAVSAGAGSVMTSFNEIAGVPSTGNPWLLTDLLRGEWGFDGFVVTDYTAINEMVNHGNVANEKEAAGLALKAGVDMDMVGSTFLNYLEELLEEKAVTMAQIDQAVRRVLKAKEKLGLFDDPYRYCNKVREQNEIMTPDNLAFARDFVARSCVLLKNEDQALPIPVTVRSIAVIGPLGDSKQDMLGNWSGAGQWEKCVTLLEGIRNRVGDQVKVTFAEGCKTEGDDRSGFADAKSVAANVDFVILALGENGWMGGEASSRSQIGLPGIQDELAAEVIKLGKPTAVVLFNSRPLAIPELAETATAILESWFGGTEAGNGIADVLFGDYNPSGKLTMTFPRNEGQIPIHYNMKNTGRPPDPGQPFQKYLSNYLDVPNDPLYPFGYGLSYTRFEYSNLRVEVAGKEIRISVEVKNAGDRDGEEVVQLYIRDLVGTLTRPVKELKGFEKLMIPAGETKTVNFKLTAEDLAFVHSDLKKYYEPGEFMVYVGTSSAETLSAGFSF